MSSLIQPVLFGAEWCEKTSLIKEFLALHTISYEYFNVDEDTIAEEKVKNLNEGKVKIPMVVIKNSTLKNPSIAFLDQKLVEHGLLDPS